MRLAPQTFWSMSLVEWRAFVCGANPRRAKPLRRHEFEDLMQRYPD